MSRRRQRKNAFSLFAFQDIITAVTGIMLLITLLLTLELVGRKAKAAQEPSEAAASSEAVVVSAEELARLEAEVAAIRKQSEKMQSENILLAKYDIQQLREQLQKTRQSNKEFREKIERLKEAALASASQREDIQKVQKRMDDINKKLQETQKKLGKIKSSSRIFVKAAKGSTKTNWLVEITKTGLKVAPLGQTIAPHSFSNAHEFKQWLAQRRQASDHFVLFVQQGGIPFYKQASQVLKQGGYSKGFDVLQQKDHIIDETTGAGIP